MKNKNLPSLYNLDLPIFIAFTFVGICLVSAVGIIIQAIMGTL